MIGGLIILIVASFAFAIQQYIGIKNLEDHLRTRIERNHAALGANDVSIIASWMTFAYVNTLFHLPADHLQTILAITDKNYPKLSIAHAAGEIKQDPTLYTHAVQTVVENYLAGNQ